MNDDDEWCCSFCGRLFDKADEDIDGINCPAVNDCPSHWEEKGTPHPDWGEPEISAATERLLDLMYERQGGNRD
jgi:hypothetical protein